MNVDNNKEEQTGNIRWYPNRGLPRVISPVFSPFTYKDTILNKINSLSPTDTIDFMSASGSVIMTKTVKSVTEMLSHVNKIIEKLDKSMMDPADLRKLMYCSPADFWKSEEIQSIIKRYMK